MDKVLALILTAASLFGAIGVTEPVAEVASTTNGSSYAFGAFTPAADAVLVVIVFATGTTAAGSMTGGSLSWTKGTSVLYNSTDTAYLFWAKTGASPGSTTITFDCTGDNATGVVMAVTQHTGSDVATSNPIRQFKTGTGTGANPSVTMDAALDTDSGYMGAFGIPRNPPTSTAPASWTEIADTGYNTPASGGTAAYRAGGETGTTVTFTSASGSWGMIVAEVYVAGEGPTGPPVNSLSLLGAGR